MIRHAVIVSALLLSVPVAASAQQSGVGAAAGATTGAVGGAIVGGPVGAVVGGVAGAVVGGIAEDNQTRFHHYVVEEQTPSYAYDGQVAVGTALPAEVHYYEVPSRFGSTKYRYTVVNQRTVLVDPRTHEVVQVIN
ncbi:DUF1236 domain-containing protein [Ancylobacter mangrovi]|uniref:DUF1236 domain-containing protein n=1 Tax=Ancylobacter mangrovi TaxID=2972472 RepID=A0A9X2T4R3_9HYPH|nr:DUF1236 domain-containing protein [Ancylobacter mangrovi]MCS0496416.1 DUF1236 domain-containing protein [Ancylobacter mangrovi]MCS0504427.1 DUF1236 domain-containing protein [Ancylobacter mangrovi]